MDYDRSTVACRYDAARELSADAMSCWMDPLSRVISPDEVALAADIGCGTGRFSQVLRDTFGVRVIGLEPSERMIHVAKRRFDRPGFLFLQSTAENLPLRDEVVDLAYMSMVYHHLLDPRNAAREFHRILRPGGYLCVRNSLVELLDSFVHLQFFPSARDYLERELPERRHLLARFEESGFELLLAEEIESVFAESFSDLQEKVGLRAQSELMRLSDVEFDAGLERMKEAAAAQMDGAPIMISGGLFIFRRTT